MEFQRMDDRGDSPRQTNKSSTRHPRTVINGAGTSCNGTTNTTITKKEQNGIPLLLSSSPGDKNISVVQSTKVCDYHLRDIPSLEIVRPYRRIIDYCKEFFCCHKSSELEFYVPDGSESNNSSKKIAYAIDESIPCCRLCCGAIHPYKMTIREIDTEAELFTIERPCSYGTGPCKCCCYQYGKITSNNGTSLLGTITETFYCWVPNFLVRDHYKRRMYTIHPPTCCFGGICIHCCTESWNCSVCFCCNNNTNIPFWIFSARQRNTNGKNAQHIGKIVSKQHQGQRNNSSNNSNKHVLEVVYPPYATTDQKALLTGSAIFLNTIFYEGE